VEKQINDSVARQFACLAALWVLSGGISFAGSVNEAASPADSHSATGALEEIIVTAQKRQEKSQSVPISMAVVTSTVIDSLHATTLQGLQGSVPNVQFSNFTNAPNTASFSIRGIGANEVDPFGGNTVAVVLDGVPQYFSYGALLDLFDVDRVEILRGPQGTLFGANTTGGVISVNTAQPTGEYGGKFEATYGNYNRIDVKAAVDFPILPGVLAGKIAGMHSGRDGWFTNIVNDQHVGKRDLDDLRGIIKYTPTESFDVTFAGGYDRSRNGSPTQANGALPGDLGYVAPGTEIAGAALPMYTGPCSSISQPCSAPSSYYTSNGSTPDTSDMDTYRGTLTIDWRRTAIGDITAITGYKHFKLTEFTDQDTTPLALVNTYRITKGWQISQELRTAFSVGDRFNFLLGGFYMKTHYDHFMNVTLDVAAPGLRQFNTQDQDNWSGSIFAQGYYQATEKLRFQAGMRFTHEKTSMLAGNETFINLSGPALLFATNQAFKDTDLGGVTASGSKAWNQAGWKLGVDYQVQPDVLLYGYYARGFKSGGFVGRIAVAQDIGPFAPEKVDTFEVGIKSEWLDHHLRANLSLFYTDYRELQVAQPYLYTNPQGGTSISSTIANADDARIKGFEFETIIAPFDGLTLIGSYAYLDAKYHSFDYLDQATQSSISLAGFQLENSPKRTVSVGATYKLPLGPGNLSAHTQLNYTSSKYFSSVTDVPRSLIQPTTYVNANLDWAPNDGKWTVGLWATNLADRRYILSVVDAPGFYDNIGYAPPREFGISYKQSW